MTLSLDNWRIVQIKRVPEQDRFVKEPNAAAECYTNNATCLSKYTSAVKYLNIHHANVNGFLCYDMYH